MWALTEFSAPDDLPPNVNRATGNIEEMRAFFGNWDLKLKKLLSLAGTCQKWKLQNSDPSALPTWVHPHGTFCLLGDAAHATLPYLAQGAAISVEDGAVLGGLLGKIRSKNDVPRVLALYEQLRRPRTSAVVLGSTKQQSIFHLHDGPEQEERDRIMLSQHPPQRGHPNQWADPVMQEFLFGYDADEEVDRAWDSLMKQYPRL
jgi:salicylate hydroxylase